MRHALLIALALGAGPAFAEEPTVAAPVAPVEDLLADEDDDLFSEEGEKKGNNADIPDAGSFKDEDDMDDMPTFSAPVKATAIDKEKDLSAFVDPRSTVGSNTKMPLDVVGKDVLGDNWSPQVVVADKDAVVIEMPVLYARNRTEFDGVAYWLVAEAFADGKKVAESRIQVTRDAIADKGPSVQFFRMFTPVPSASGVIVVNISKAASIAAKPTLLFTRSVNYKL
ncbi:MAG: hypothetical protein Q8P41_32155 [Pseudomonadota bacterium]|nr:hypothetical protein [Pseudomonadota bacterium]